MGAGLVQVFAANRRSGKQATTSLRTLSFLPLVGLSGHHACANQHEPSCSKRSSGATGAIERHGPSRNRWWARSRPRQGASLRSDHAERRGFGLDRTLDRAEDRRLRDGPDKSARAGICHSHGRPDGRHLRTRTVPELIPLARCRELLGDEALDLSDEEIDAIRRHAHVMAHVLIEIFLQQHADRRD